MSAERFAWKPGDVVRRSPEERAYGLGGQFAKGGGRIPGRGGQGTGSGAALSDEQVADFMTAAGRSARDHLEPDGSGGYRFTAERAALHERLIEDALAGYERSATPTLTVLGGGPGAGKSTTSEKVGVPGKDRAAWADPDGFKQGLPEYDPKNPGVVHEESSYLAKEMTRRAQERGYDVVIDGVGDNVASVHTKVAAAKAAGYRTVGAYTWTEVDMASGRNAARARSVPDTMLRLKHRAVSANFTRLAEEFDAVELWANMNGAAPALTARGGGGALTVVDGAGWSAFQAIGG